jgi:hypothetical protein
MQRLYQVAPHCPQQRITNIATLPRLDIADPTCLARDMSNCGRCNNAPTSSSGVNHPALSLYGSPHLLVQAMAKTQTFREAPRNFKPIALLALLMLPVNSNSPRKPSKGREAQSDALQNCRCLNDSLHFRLTNASRGPTMQRYLSRMDIYMSTRKNAIAKLICVFTCMNLAR